jgi:hypothetical protein
MAKAKLAFERVKTRKALPIYGGENLPAGTEITLTDDWETIPPARRGRIILDPQGQRRLADEEDLEYALGAH